MNIVVLGCGPAGLMAAQGAADAGASTIRIYSKKRKSELFGAQYLHQPIPGVTEGEPIHVRYNLNGDPDEYREKVYGRNWDGPTSPEDLPPNHHAWDIRQTYDALWDRWQPYVKHVDDLTPGQVSTAVHDLGRGTDIIINSVPRPVICSEGHTFGAQQIWAAGDAPERGVRLPYQCPPNTVLCNGLENPSWYRLSNIFDYHTVEWSMHSMPKAPPIGQPALVNKPTRHNCSCWPSIHHVGRYGQWAKGVLSHTAYNDARSLVEAALREGIQSEIPL